MRTVINFCAAFYVMLASAPACAQLDTEAIANQSSTTKTTLGRKEVLATGYFHESLNSYAQRCGFSVPPQSQFTARDAWRKVSQFLIATCPTENTEIPFGGVVLGYMLFPSEAGVRNPVTKRYETVRAYSFATVGLDRRSNKKITIGHIGTIKHPEEGLFPSFRTIENGSDLISDTHRVDNARPNLMWPGDHPMSWAEALLIGALFYAEKDSEFAQVLQNAHAHLSPFIEQKVSLWPESMRQISPKFESLMSVVQANLANDPAKSRGLPRSPAEFSGAEKAMGAYAAGERKAEVIGDFFTPETVLKPGGECMAKVHESILSGSFSRDDPGRFPYLDKALYQFEGPRIHGDIHRAAADLLRVPFPKLRNPFWLTETLPSGLAILANENCHQIVLRLKKGMGTTHGHETTTAIAVLTLDEFAAGYGSGTIKGAEAFSTFANERKSMEGTSFLCTPLRCFTGKFEELLQSNEVELSSKLAWPPALKARILAAEVKRHNTRVKAKKSKS